MAIEEGYCRYACDRSAKCHEDGKLHIEFLTPQDKRASEYHKVEWVDKNGVQMHSTLCSECYSYWKTLAQNQAETNEQFMYKGL